jgi:hypothetical protein
MHQIESLGYCYSEHPHFFKKKKKVLVFLERQSNEFS